MVMYDGDPTSTAGLAADYNLTFPILSDPSGEVFARFNESAGNAAVGLHRAGHDRAHGRCDLVPRPR